MDNDNNEEIIFSNNENENLNNNFFKNNKITIEEEVYIPEEERLYINDALLIKEIESQLLNTEPVSRQGLKYIQENIKLKATKIIDAKNSLNKEVNMYKNNINNPIIYDFLHNNFKNNWVIPITLNKHKIFSKLTEDNEQININEDSDFFFTDTLEDEKGITIENQITQFITMKKLLHESNLNKLPYKDYINEISNISQPYSSILLGNSDYNSGYITKINQDIHFLRYSNLETMYWNNYVKLADTTTFIDILDENRKLQRISEIPLVKTDSVNIIGFMILPNGGNNILDIYNKEIYSKSFYTNNLSKVLVKIGDIKYISTGKNIKIKIDNHNLKDKDKIIIMQTNSIPSINGLYQKSVTVIDNNNISINVKNDIKNEGDSGVIYTVSRLNFDLYHINKNKAGNININYIKTVNSAIKESNDNPKVYIMDNLIIYDKKDLDVIYKQIIPSNNAIIKNILGRLKQCYTIRQINDILIEYGLSINNLNEKEYNIINEIIKNNINILINNEKNIKTLNNKKYFIINKQLFNDESFFLNNSNLNNNEVTTIYGKYPYFNTEFDNVQLRLKWLFSQLDGGNLYFKLYSLENYKNFYNKQDIKNISNELANINKEILASKKEFNKEGQLNKNIKNCKLYKYIIDDKSQLNDIDKSTLIDNTLALYRKNNDIKIYEWDKKEDTWKESTIKPIYNNLKFLCEFSNTELNELTLDDLECIYRKDFGCKSRLYYRYENRLHKLETIQNDYHKLVEYIKNDIFKKEIHEEIENLKNKFFQRTMGKTPIKKTVKSVEIDEKIEKESIPDNKINDLIRVINNLNSNELRRNLLYQIIDKDGLLIGKNIYSKKYKTKLNICGHYYYLKREYYTNDVELKNNIIIELLNIFSDNGESSHDAHICNNCGTYLLNVEYDDSEGFNANGMIIRSRQVWAENEMSYEEVNITDIINEKIIKCNDPYFQDLLLEKGLHISEVNNALKICTFVENNLMSKCGVRINIRDLIIIIIDCIQKIKLIIPYSIFKAGRVKFYINKGYNPDKIDKLEKRGHFKDEYEKYYNLKRSCIIAARFLINVQTVIPPYNRDSSKSPCSFTSFDGIDGTQYIACILKEMNVISTDDDKQNNLINILVKNIDEAYNNFKYNKKINELFEKKIKYNKNKLIKIDILYDKNIINKNISLPNIIKEDIVNDVKNGPYKNTEKYKILYYQNIYYASRKIIKIINKVISKTAPIDKLNILIENNCCLQDLEEYISYYDYIALNYNNNNVSNNNNVIIANKNVNEIYKNIFNIINYVNDVYKYNYLFLNIGVFDRLKLYDKNKDIALHNDITLFRPNNVNNEIIKDLFCLYVDKGEYFGTLRKYTGFGEQKKDIITGDLYIDIQNKKYTIDNYNELLEKIKILNYQKYTPNEYNIKNYINKNIISLKKDSFEYLESRINTLVSYLAKSLNQQYNKEFINKYTKLLKNLGDFTYHENISNDTNKQNEVKNNNLLNELKLKYLKKVYNIYLRQNINIIKNGLDKSKENIELDFGLHESIIMDIQQLIYAENNRFAIFKEDNIKKYFTNIKFDLSLEKINKINGINDIYDIKYKNIIYLSDFNFNSACNVILYLFVEQLIKYLICADKKDDTEDVLIDEITLTNNEEDDLIKELEISSDKCKYISQFCIEIFNIIEDDYDYLDICNKNMHKFKNILLQDILIKNTKNYMKDEEESKDYFMKMMLRKMHKSSGFSVDDVNNEALMEQEGTDAMLTNIDKDEYLNEMAIKELTKKYGSSPTKDQIEEYKQEYINRSMEKDIFDEETYDLYRAKQGLDVIDVGTGYGEMDHTIEDEGDLVIADPDYYDEY